MLDFSMGELTVIGAVALVVLGPERLPRVARSIGEWVGKAQRYVGQVKADIQREVELSELKRLQDAARDATQQIDATVREAAAQAQGGAEGEAAAQESPALEGFAWNQGGWRTHQFQRRYRPGPSIDQLAEEVARLRRQLAMPDAAVVRGKYAPRSRINRTRVRR